MSSDADNSEAPSFIDGFIRTCKQLEAKVYFAHSRLLTTLLVIKAWVVSELLLNLFQSIDIWTKL